MMLLLNHPETNAQIELNVDFEPGYPPSRCCGEDDIMLFADPGESASFSVIDAVDVDNNVNLSEKEIVDIFGHDRIIDKCFDQYARIMRDINFCEEI